MSVNKLQRISKLKDWNSHLALKTAMRSRCDVNSVILTIAYNRNIQGNILLLMQNYDKIVAVRIPVRIAGHLHRQERKYRRFLTNVNH